MIFLRKNSKFSNINCFLVLNTRALDEVPSTVAQAQYTGLNQLFALTAR